MSRPAHIQVPSLRAHCALVMSAAPQFACCPAPKMPTRFACYAGNQRTIAPARTPTAAATPACSEPAAPLEVGAEGPDADADPDACALFATRVANVVVSSVSPLGTGVTRNPWLS